MTCGGPARWAVPVAGSGRARAAAAERAAAVLVPARPVLRPAGPGTAVSVQPVRGQALVAPGHLVGLPVLADLTDRAAVRHPGLLLGARRGRLAPHHAHSQPEGADEQRRDQHAYHHDRGT